MVVSNSAKANMSKKYDQVLMCYREEQAKIDSKQTESLEEISDSAMLLSELQKIDWSFQNNYTTYLTHDIHPYPAKYIPQIPSTVLKRMSLQGELIWDPFGGSGTTALEALLLNRRCISSDANPLSTVIGMCKTLSINTEEQRDLSIYKSFLQDIVRENEITFEHNFIPKIPNIDKWFHSNVIKELSFIKKTMVSLSEKCMIIAKTALSRTVAKMSNQDGETRYSSVNKEVNIGETINCFVNDLDFVLIKLMAVSHLLEGKEAIFKTYDLRNSILDGNGPVKENQVDLIVTSPPYANATDYHLYHRFRMFWLNFDPITFGKEEIGSHLRHQKEKTGFSDYMIEMEECLKNCFYALKPGRYAVFVLGDSIFSKVFYDTAEAYQEVAEKIGFEFVGKIKRELHTTKRSFEGPARRAKDETILIVKKPPQKMKISMFEPNYKLWGYEEELLRLEVETVVGASTIQKNDKAWVIEASAKDLQKIKKLTFISRYKASSISEELTWQGILENSDQAKGARRDSKYVTHGIHEYKGKFYPQLCKSLYNLANLSVGSKVLDPFGGSGTTALEGYLNGYKTYSCDMNPLAVMIQRAKTEILEVNPVLLADTINHFIASVVSEQNRSSTYLEGQCPGAIQELKSWFPIPVISKMGIILDKIDRIPDLRISNFLKVILSNIIRSASQQEPTDLRIRRRSVPIQDADVIGMFISDLRSQVGKLEKYFRQIQFSPNSFIKPTIWEGDSRDIFNFNRSGLKNETIDAVITSPPYATALPYIDTNRLSLLVLLGLTNDQRNPIEEGLIGTREIKKMDKVSVEEKIEANDFSGITSEYAINLINNVYRLNNSNKVGFRRKNMASLLYNYFNDMTLILDNVDKLLKDRGSAFIVIGNNTTTSGETRIDIRTTQMLEETGNQLGWTLFKEIPITVTSDNLKHINNSIKTNTVMWFKK